LIKSPILVKIGLFFINKQKIVLISPVAEYNPRNLKKEKGGALNDGSKFNL
jgi:hypothetical protein